MNLSILSLTISSLKKLFLVYIIFLLFMSIFRVIFFIYYNELDSFTNFNFDMLNMLFLGFRLDLTVIGYIQVIPSFCLIFSYYLNSERVFYLFNKFLVYYLFIIFVIVSLLFVADFGFYSYFKDRLNILFFGLFEDDTVALLKTFWENYNVILILGVFFIYLVILFYIIKKIFQKDFTNQNFLKFIKIPVVFFLALLAFNFFIIRGTFGMYPLGKMIPNISQSEYINKMSQNSVRAFISANSVRNKFKKNKIDYIKETGFENNIERAFEIHKGTTNIDRENLLNNITYTTKKVDDEDYNIVVIMVESFGIPILKYQSEEFDIMGNLKKHFEEDILFSNIISEGDGTISSLEALFLNIPYRPNSFPFSQSKFAQTSFAFSPAFLYTNAGFNTSFIYGGDLTWRDLGKFVKFQSYDSVEGKQDVFASIKVTKEKSEYFHPWGIYDEYLYEHILNKLETSNKKEMILALSTNNHPPYDIPKNYETKIKSYSEDLKNHIIGDFDLAKQRFKSYGYALDSVGTFLDKFKKSKFKDNTIVVITADNNTIEGIMKYDDNPIFTSKNIPIYFYLPKKLKDRLEIDTSVAGSQKDIFPTLYNLTLKDTKYLSIGNNLFDKIYPHFGFNGSMIVNHGNEVRKLNSLKEKSEDELVNYYKASLAVTEYLIKRYDNKGNK
ncbi:LTA synthase family protein [Aliarcobacter cryaerophilus]|uniref:Phosphoglycerol transferase n=1 Tax=Aliarcobacter cryaerophilus TaxID=28198 RepID=A0A2S9SKV5_9BACT|nr:alkaline phosphatase family protein [Aliarcobacter cryaerophilus]PRM87210.1 phosphoglycerol transferase [Aliarcobacter cryaerophilus]